MRRCLFALCRVLIRMLVLTAPLSCSVSADWPDEQIADALRAAPPTVTHQAQIYAWTPYGQLVLVRGGDGPYTCVASGSSSLRFGKPPLPSPDPFCADRNAWAFIEASWKEPDLDPAEPIKPLPRAPGLVWMLAGKNVVTGQVADSEDAKSPMQTVHSEAAQDTANAAQGITRLPPHLMILPLPIDPTAMQLPMTYDPTQPLALWRTVSGTPIAYVLVHVPDAVHKVLTAIPLDLGQ